MANAPATNPDSHQGHDHSKGHDHADHGHGHDHDHDHSHVPTVTKDNERKILTAFLIIVSYMVVEAVGGIVSGSLALLADAGHMMTDAIALGLAYVAFRLGRRRADGQRTFGYARFEVIAGLVNALTLFGIVGWILYEAFQRFNDPQPVLAGSMFVVALVGLLVNVFVLWYLTRGDTEHVNVKGAVLHVMGDLLGSVGAIVAAVVIWYTGWTPIDPILSIVVALLILRSTWRLLRQTTDVLMERVPSHLDYAAIGRSLAAIPGVRDVHDLHVWSMGAGEVSLSAHMGVASGDVWPAVLAAAQRQLRERYGIRHVTLQPDWPRASKGAGKRVIPVAESRR